MNYYAEDKSSRRWAAAVTAIYVAVIAAALLLVSFDFESQESVSDTLLVVLEEQTAVAVEHTRPTGPAVPHTHAEEAKTESFERDGGEQEKVQTVNQRALFKMSNSGVDDPAPAGNPRAEVADKDASSGKGDGSDAYAGSLDAGLQGRGLVGVLPKPEYTANAAGKVLIDVTVDASGRVTTATYRQNGSTTNNSVLVEAARRAALKARFTESDRFVQGGTITYIFRME